MKKILFIAFLSLSQFVFAQDKGTIKGVVTDKEMNNEPLPFANVFIKGTSIGGNTDMDGTYTIPVSPGKYTLVFSFVGYQTIEKEVVVTAGQTITVNQVMGASGGEKLEEIQINATVSKEKESALLLEQKKATVIKESIGAVELAKKGVSNAATATTKISGVTKSDASGDIYIRGLGDRYLSTRMNGLPIPSDNVDKKNINLNLFSTQVIQNVGISKTYVTSRYADEASGNVNVVSKEYSKDMFSINVSGGTNTNLLNLDGDFRKTIISDDITFGFHEKKFALVDQITQQGWDTKTNDGKPFNFSGSISAGKKFKLLGKDFRIFATASHSESSNYRDEIFRSFRSNIEDNGFSTLEPDLPQTIANGVDPERRDVERFIHNINTTGYINVKTRLNDNNKLRYNTLFVNKGQEVLYEAGRKGFGYVFDQDPQEFGAFVRDQNYRQTTMFVNQLLGEHKWNETNTLNWGAGYNFVLAEEPNRIRNEVNILDFANSPLIEFSAVGDFQQRKSGQKIEDTEYNGFISNSWKLGAANEDDDKPFKLNYGLNYRKRERSFRSQFIGVRARGVQAPSIDELSGTFTTSGFNNNLTLRVGEVDRFVADLQIIAGYVNFDFDFDNNLSGNLGLSYEYDEMTALWDITNYISPNGTPRVGSLEKTYGSLYPSVNLKYEINERNFLRFASSITQTLPEFKEVSPFEYVTPTGRVIKGNPNVEKSDVYNIDLKWEFFPSRGELISATAFYKQIENPINLALTRGSSGNFQFANTGEQADVLGFEIEGRLDVLKNDDDQGILNITANATGMWFEQDLLENFQYNSKTTSGLQGASNYIFNGSITYNNRAENEFIATLVGNYSSDKIFALGGPEDFANSAVLFNEEIIEKGFVTLDMVLSKQITKGFTVKLIGRNLLNPDIDQTQLIVNQITGSETNEIVRRYNRGTQLSLGLSYNF
ncbi:TonB-dependent receptor [Tenacibaculum sp. SZ-18]|uniref:TonB-dependent receptor n=1 Tax=Tenacibaculum sp. SZ-18 TaxID=754423 RepID=UPI000C2D3130|nr:TonB-dependent receptor [Tenacibaculum sp. SZ-18]AUC16382.1 TonB-dependent receptor [Tenacibaculum sp. SZ-18]